MKEHKHKVYTAEDFERYYSGQMSEAEMHALEKSALEDPFLADALEGYSYTKTSLSDVAELRERLSKRIGIKLPELLFLFVLKVLNYKNNTPGRLYSFICQRIK